MVFFKRSALALLLLAARRAFADVQEPLVAEDANEIPDVPHLKVTVDVSFPQSEIFGVKLVNGHPTRAVLSFGNQETEQVSIVAVGGTLISDAVSPPQTVRNLTMQRFGLDIAGGATEQITYTFTTDLHPQDLRLVLTGIVKDHKDSFYTLGLYNSTVSVVEAPISIFDPQLIFLYVILAAAFSGTCYFIYTTWITTLFPQQKRKSAGDSSRPKYSGGVKSKKSPTEPSSPDGGATSDGAEGATTTGSKAYDESWLPAHHLQRPEAKKVASSRSATPKTKARG